MTDVRDLLIAAGTTALESGNLANMRTLRANSTVHTRLLTQRRTLCGRPLMTVHGWSWQFINRGDAVAGRVPAGADDFTDGCKSCQRSAVLQMAMSIAEKRQTELAKRR